MNEAYSDYFGNAIEVEVSGTPESSPEYNYLGEDLCRPGATTLPCPTRNMADGRTTRDYTFYLVDIDNGGVHLNSTIYSGALWDLRKALDPHRADEIVYEALTRFLTPLDGYIAGRRATIAAADTQVEKQSVRAAFDGRGITDGWITDSADNDARILRQNLAPLGFAFSPPEASGARYAVADYRNKRVVCCVPEQIFAGRIAGKGSGRRVSQPNKRTVYNEEYPAISGRRAVWARADINLNFDVVGRRVGGRLGPVRGVTHSDATWEWYPAIDGRLVAWERLNPAKPDTDIYARYLGTKKKIKVAGAPGPQFFPQVDGDWVVFWKPGSRKMSIGAHNLRTGERFKIDAGRRSFLGLPDVGGGYLYWYQDRDFFTRRADNRGSIRRTKLSGGGKVIQTIVGSGKANSPYWQGLSFPPRPSANKRWVTYSSEFGFTRRAGLPPNRQGRKIFKVRARPGARPRRVTANRGDQAYPVIARNNVLWLDSTFARADLMTKRL